MHYNVYQVSIRPVGLVHYEVILPSLCFRIYILDEYISSYCPHPPLRMGAIAVSGKILCLPVTQYCVAYHSATVGEIDTKPVLYNMQHL